MLDSTERQRNVDGGGEDWVGESFGENEDPAQLPVRIIQPPRHFLKEIPPGIFNLWHPTTTTTVPTRTMYELMLQEPEADIVVGIPF